MGSEIFLAVLFVLLFVLLFVNFVILDCTVSKMKKDNRLNLDVVTAITALEMATKKLNEKLKCETQSLSDYKQRLKRLEKRIDILEEGHPDTDIDYGEVDDDANVIAVWFNGKKYIPEDKRNEDTIKLYVDNCNNYEKAYTATKGEVDYPYIHIPYGNGETDRIMKRVDELQCEIQRLNLIANIGCTAQEVRQRWEELMQK